MKHIPLLCLFLLLTIAGIVAQDITYGFRAGLTRSTIDGPSEQSALGDLEEYNYNTGFHIGGGVKIPFSDLIGLRTELVYSQKGAKYTYSGKTIRFYRTEAGGRVRFEGSSNMSLEINHSYLEIPVMAYGRFWDVIEVSAGFHAGVLVGSNGGGKWTFTGVNAGGIGLETNSNLDYNYFSDEPGEFTSDDITQVMYGNTILRIPETLGAYYHFDEDRGNAWNTFEFGLDAGIAFLLNQGLSLGIRGQFGLTDISNEDADVARAESNGDEFIFRDDQDQNIAIQFSVGFNF